MQQLHDWPEPEVDEPDIMTAMLGPPPPAQTLEIEDFFPRIAARGGPVLVVNDEAHQMGRKPILFVMMNDMAEADDVGNSPRNFTMRDTISQ